LLSRGRPPHCALVAVKAMAGTEPANDIVGEAAGAAEDDRQVGKHREAEEEDTSDRRVGVAARSSGSFRGAVNRRAYDAAPKLGFAKAFASYCSEKAAESGELEAAPVPTQPTDFEAGSEASGPSACQTVQPSRTIVDDEVRAWLARGVPPASLAERPTPGADGSNSTAALLSGTECVGESVEMVAALSRTARTVEDTDETPQCVDWPDKAREAAPLPRTGFREGTLLPQTVRTVEDTDEATPSLSRTAVGSPSGANVGTDSLAVSGYPAAVPSRESAAVQPDIVVASDEVSTLGCLSGDSNPAPSRDRAAVIASRDSKEIPPLSTTVRVAPVKLDREPATCKADDAAIENDATALDTASTQGEALEEHRTGMDRWMARILAKGPGPLQTLPLDTAAETPLAEADGGLSRPGTMPLGSAADATSAKVEGCLSGLSSRTASPVREERPGISAELVGVRPAQGAHQAHAAEAPEDLAQGKRPAHASAAPQVPANVVCQADVAQRKAAPAAALAQPLPSATSGNVSLVAPDSGHFVPLGSAPLAHTHVPHAPPRASAPVQCDFAKGEAVHIWSNSKGQWVTDGIVDEVLHGPKVSDGVSVAAGATIPAGAVRVTSSVGTKWVMPHLLFSQLRKARPMTSAFVPGAVVQVWSNSKGAWLNDAVVCEVSDGRPLSCGITLPLGSVRVRSSAGEKWLTPDQIGPNIRKPATHVQSAGAETVAEGLKPVATPRSWDLEHRAPLPTQTRQVVAPLQHQLGLSQPQRQASQKSLFQAGDALGPTVVELPRRLLGAAMSGKLAPQAGTLDGKTLYMSTPAQAPSQPAIKPIAAPAPDALGPTVTSLPKPRGCSGLRQGAIGSQTLVVPKQGSNHEAASPMLAPRPAVASCGSTGVVGAVIRQAAAVPPSPMPSVSWRNDRPTLPVSQAVVAASPPSSVLSSSLRGDGSVLPSSPATSSVQSSPAIVAIAAVPSPTPRVASMGSHGLAAAASWSAEQAEKPLGEDKSSLDISQRLARANELQQRLGGRSAASTGAPRAAETRGSASWNASTAAGPDHFPCDHVGNGCGTVSMLPPPPRGAPASQGMGSGILAGAPRAAEMRGAAATNAPVAGPGDPFGDGCRTISMLPPPPRGAPAARNGGSSNVAGFSQGTPDFLGVAGSNSCSPRHVLQVLVREGQWEKLAFAEIGNLEQLAAAFLQRHGVKATFKPGLVEMMRSMAASGQAEAKVDIIDLL